MDAVPSNLLINRNGLFVGKLIPLHGLETILAAAALVPEVPFRIVGSEQLDEGAVAHQGDVIRIGYRVSDTAFGVIASVDGRGVVTLHHPAATPRATRLRGGEVVLLDQAYELDDAPKWERFYIVTGTTEFEVAPIVDAIARLAASSNGAAPLPLSSTLNQATFQLQKESRP